MKLSVNYGKYAAGPLDPKLMYMVDAEFKKQEWFQVVKRDNNYGFKYEPLGKVDNYKKYYARYYGHQADQIMFLINLFRKERSAFCEVIATLYAVWKELIENKTIVNEATLIKGFYEWSPSKSKFTKEKLAESIVWIKQRGISPN